MAESGTGGFGSSSASTGGTGGTSSGGVLGGQNGPHSNGDPGCERRTGRTTQLCLVDSWSDEDAGADDQYAIYDLELTGTVEAIVPSVPCKGVGGGGTDAFGYGVRIVSEAGGATFGFAVPWQDPLFAIGEVLHVKYHRDGEPAWSEGFPPTGSVVIRGADGQLLYWTAETFHGFDDLAAPPELTVTDGSSSCSFEGGYCGTVKRTSLLVTSGGESVDVPFAQANNVGDFVVLHMDNELHTSATCGALANHHVSVIAVRGSNLALLSAP